MPSGLIYFLAFTAVLTLFSLLCIAYEIPTLGRHAALSFILYPDHLFDLHAYRDRWHLLHTPGFFSAPGFPWYYPAPAAFVYAPLYKLVGWHTERQTTALFLLSGLLLAGAAALLLARGLMRAGLTAPQAGAFVVLSAATSYPFYCAFERGNIEAFLWLAPALGCWCLLRRQYFAASVLFGIGGSFKLYPLFFLALFLKQRRFAECLAGIAAFLLSTLAGLRFLEPNVVDAFRHEAAGTHAFTIRYSIQGTVTDHSIFGSLRLLLSWLHLDRSRGLQVYLVLAGVVMMIWFFKRIIHLPLLNQITFITVASIVLPPTSFNYTLCMLYIPLALFALLETHRSTRGGTVPGLQTVLALLALSMACGTFPILNGRCYEGTLRMFFLLGLMISSSAWPFSMELVGDLKVGKRPPAPGVLFPMVQRRSMLLKCLRRPLPNSPRV